MKSMELKRELETRLARPSWQFKYTEKDDTLRIEDKEKKKGLTLSLAGLANKRDAGKESYFEEVVEYVEEAMLAMLDEQHLSGQETAIFPVIRSTSFPKETNAGDKLIFDEHTAETAVYYALDLGKTYRLIDERFLKEEGWEVTRVKEAARFNLRSLEEKVTEDHVAGNTFYFVNTKDGYDASRILNQTLLDSVEKKISGTMAVAVPHQDVLIFADLQNNTGYDVLGQMAMSFFASGRVPITALPFLYENGELEPVFIMAKNRPTD